MTNSKILSIFMLFILFTWTSCSNSTDDVKNTNLREQLFSDKDYNETKKIYKSLDSSSKINLWIEKLNNLLILDLPSEHLELINSLVLELENAESSNRSNMVNIAINLAKITPEKDFHMMFGTLDDYDYKGNFTGNHISKDLILEMENLDVRYLSQKSNTKMTSRLVMVECNCKWTCSFFETASSQGENCETSNGGCGFLWIQDCEYHV